MDRLSERQKQVLELLAHGHSSKEIGKILCTSPETVRKHLAKIRDALGMRRAVEMAMHWHAQNKVSSQETPCFLPPQKCLTPREQEVALLLAKGLSIKKVASALNMAPATAAKHRENLFKKLGINKASLLPQKLK